MHDDDDCSIRPCDTCKRRTEILSSPEWKVACETAERLGFDLKQLEAESDTAFYDFNLNVNQLITTLTALMSRINTTQPWEDDKLQFARLICEADAVLEPTQRREICDSMDLSPEDLNELFNRATLFWRTAVKAITGEDSELGHLR